MAFGGPDGLSPPTQSSPELELWAAQIQAELKKAGEATPILTAADIGAGTFPGAAYTFSGTLAVIGAVTLTVALATSNTVAKVISVTGSLGAASSGGENPDITADLNSLTGGGTPVAGDFFVYVDGTLSRKIAISSVPLSIFNDDLPAGGTVTSVGSGDGLSGGPITGSGSLAVDSTVLRTTGAQSKAGILTLTDVLRADVGAVGTPGLSFDGDGNTGIYRPAADQLGLVAGGIRRILIDHNGTGLGVVTIEDAQLQTQEFSQGDTDDSIDWDEGNICTMNNSTATGARTLTYSNMKDGGSYRIIVTRVNVGAQPTWTWTTAGSDVLFPGNAAPIMSTAADLFDIIDLMKVNGVIYGTFSLRHSTLL